MELYYIIQLNFLLLPKNKRRMSITFKYDVLVIGGGHAGAKQQQQLQILVQKFV